MSMVGDDTSDGRSERERLAAHLETLEGYLATLKGEREDAEGALKAQSEYVTTICHELRTSLGAVFAFADLLAGTELDTTQREYAQQLVGGSQDMLSLLNDVLDHARLSEGRLELDARPFSLNRLIGSVGKTLDGRCRAKGIQVNIGYAGEPPDMLDGDATCVRQILMNFIDNAVKFTTSGTVSLLVEKLTEGDDDVLLRFCVRDTGAGVPDEVRDRLFSAFQQGDDATPGTGLGLSIASKLVALMDGEIGFDSVVDTGSVFWFTARFGRVAEEETQAEDDDLFAEGAAGDVAPAQIEMPVRPEGAPPHVLIVEDNRVNQMLVTTYLTKFGYTFTVVDNGYDAIEEVKQTYYDLILMDIHMPEIDGLETTSAIRTLGGRAAAMPIIAVTANVLHERRRTYLDAGMDACLTKPIDAMELLATMTEHLERPNRPVVEPASAEPAPQRGGERSISDDTDLFEDEPEFV